MINLTNEIEENRQFSEKMFLDAFVKLDSYRKTRNALLDEFKSRTIEVIERTLQSSAKEDHGHTELTIFNFSDDLLIYEVSDINRHISRYFLGKGYYININILEQDNIIYALLVRISWNL